MCKKSKRARHVSRIALAARRAADKRAFLAEREVSRAANTKATLLASIAAVLEGGS